jgi:hypothetical protein
MTSRGASLPRLAVPKTQRLASPRSPRPRDVREVILHVITETATHAGHLDAARELLDGRTWMGPEETRVARD